MVLINTALCLPTLEVSALAQGKSIVAMPKRFIVPGKRFALISSCALPDSQSKDFLYNQSALEKYSHSDDTATNKNLLTAWAKCEACQHITDSDKFEALSLLTIWTKEALSKHLLNNENLFLAFLRIYRLSTPIKVEIGSEYYSSEHLGKFVPLAKYLDLSEENAVLDDQIFSTYQNNLTELRVKPVLIETLSSQTEFTSQDNDLEVNNSDKPKDLGNQTQEDLLDSPDWFKKIAEIGNSSDGNTFERMVRKSFITLGFSNSESNPKASLDPKKTGGAGGLDIYCESPYPLIGECKATKNKKINDQAAAKLLQHGRNWLPTAELFESSVKLLIAAGQLGIYLNTLEKNKIGILSPETLERLVSLKNVYYGSFNPLDLKPILDSAPFGFNTDEKVQEFISEKWKSLKIRSSLVETVSMLCRRQKQPAAVIEVRSSFNASFANPLFFDNPLPELEGDEQTRDLLIELSSPLTGYLGREAECFYYLRSLQISE